MAEALLYLTTANADIATGLFYKYLRPVGGGTGSQTISLAKDEVQTGYGYSYPSEIDLRAGTGTITLVVHVTTTSTDMTCRVRAHRTDSNGSILASTNWTATQTLGASRTFTTPSVDWTGANSTDRLRIDYEFTTAAHSASATIQLGGTQPYVDTPFTNQLAISVDATGGGTTNPAPGTHDYVVAGKQVQIEAIPEDLTKAFDKWVIDSVDVLENPTTVTMSQDVTAVAHFAEADQYDLTVSVTEGVGTVNPTAGVHTYYEGQTVTITADATTENYNAIIILNSATILDNVEYFATAEFIMPSEDVTASVKFVEPFVRLQRSDGNQESWFDRADVSDPDTAFPNDYLDEDTFVDTVEYFYRAKRIENNVEPGWSNVDSVVYIGVAVGDVSISAPTAISDTVGNTVTVTAIQFISVLVVPPIAIVLSVATAPIVISVINIIIPTISATSTSDATSPTITALTVINATVIPPPTEADTEGIVPSIIVVSNISITSPVAVANSQSDIPTVSAAKLVSILSPISQSSIEAVIPNISSIVNTSILIPIGITNAEAFALDVSATHQVSIISATAQSSSDAGNVQLYVEGSVHTTVASPTALCSVEAVTPNITSTKNVSITTPSAINNAQADVPSVSTESKVSITSSQALSEADAVVPQINTTKLVSIVAVSGNSNSTATEPQITTVKLVSLNIPQGIVTTQAIIPIITTQQNPTVTTLPATEVEMASAIIHWSVTLPEGGGE